MARGEEDSFILTSAAARLATPSHVSLGPFFSPYVSPPFRRLSSCFTEPSRPAATSRKSLAWISLQGRLVGADDATSVGAIAGGELGREEAAAWELFSPLQRVLTVAVVAVAASQSKKEREIVELQRSVDLRDEVLLSMQQKLDTLSEQMDSHHEQPMKFSSLFPFGTDQFVSVQKPELGAPKLCLSRSPLPELNPESGVTPLCRNISHLSDAKKESGGVESDKEEVCKNENPTVVEHEERRMSDLSDFNWSVTSSVDFQLSTLAAEQEFYNLRMECEEKDTKMKELTAAALASSIADSKRITELEEIIRRKNKIISKLKKDMLFLEQQVINFTRLRRASSSPSNSSDMHLPVMTNNILYDMSSTSPSSSDPESPVSHRQHSTQSSAAKSTSKKGDTVEAEVSRQPLPLVDHMVTLNRSSDRVLKKSSSSSLKENRRIQKSEPASAVRQRQLASSSADSKKTKGHTHQELKSTGPQKR